MMMRDQMAEEQYAEVEDQLLKEVPIAHGAQGQNVEKENPPAVSIPIGGTPILTYYSRGISCAGRKSRSTKDRRLKNRICLRGGIS